MALTEDDLRRALLDERFPAEDLLQIFRNRGYRDALVSLAIRIDGWDALADAARRSIAERGAQNDEVPFGEFTVLAIVSWRSQGALYPTAEDLEELMLQGKEEDARLLRMMLNVQENGVPFRIWEAAFRDLNIGHCIEFAIQEKTKGEG